MKSSTPATAAVLAAVAVILGGSNAAAAPSKPEPPMEAFSKDPERAKICKGFAEVYNESIESGQEAVDEGDIDGAAADADIADRALEGARNAGCEMMFSG